MDGLKGYKTYLIAAAAALVVGLQAAGILQAEQAEIAYGLLGAGGISTLAAKINRQA